VSPVRYELCFYIPEDDRGCSVYYSQCYKSGNMKLVSAATERPHQRHKQPAPLQSICLENGNVLARLMDISFVKP
jgi:hypothetical protein